MNKLLSVIVVVLIIGGLVYLSLTRSYMQSTSETGKIPVAASFYPLYFFAQQIGGDKADVVDITPAGGEPHDYEPTAQDIKNIVDSRLLILNGSLEAWGDKIKQDIDPSKTLLVVAGEGLTTQKVEEDGDTIVDPHVWLSPLLAEEMADKIAQGFMTVDPADATYYQNNLANLKARLSDLDMKYRTGLASCAQKDIITSHAAFGYLATTYGLKQVSIAGLSPDAEPSPAALADIANFARTNDVKVIFFESLVSPKLSETIAHEVGAQTMVLDPIEGLSDNDSAAGENYFTKMQDNLANLRTALECK